MKKKILIIDYGFGNLFGLQKALTHAGANAGISENPCDMQSADALVLPGVGAFGGGMAEMKKRGFKQPILDQVAAGKPLLGICLGMQFLFEKSYEFGEHEGLGILEGEVKKIPVTAGSQCKIPHIGWNALLAPGKGGVFASKLLAGIKPHSQTYFVHSYAGYPSRTDDIQANTCYYDSVFPAVVARKNAFGVQFHPEKSGETGITLLRNFLSLS